jgi:hypothetical protein
MYVTSAAPDVQEKYAAQLASPAAGIAMKKKMEERCSAISVKTRDLLPNHALDWRAIRLMGVFLSISSRIFLSASHSL